LNILEPKSKIRALIKDADKNYNSDPITALAAI
jgi:hypothetical protein